MCGGQHNSLHFLFNVVNIKFIFFKKGTTRRRLLVLKLLNTLRCQRASPGHISFGKSPQPPGCLGLQLRVGGVSGPTDGQEVGKKAVG